MLLARPDRIEAELFSVNHEFKGVCVVGDLRLAIGEKSNRVNRPNCIGAPPLFLVRTG
jgi:hypothetical protein